VFENLLKFILVKLYVVFHGEKVAEIHDFCPRK
jgi:hypothetical protein